MKRFPALIHISNPVCAHILWASIWHISPNCWHNISLRSTAARRPKQCRRAALCKTDFNRYLSNGRSNKKISTFQKVYFPKVHFPKVYFFKVYFPKVYFSKVYFPKVYFPKVYFPKVYFPKVYFPKVYFCEIYPTCVSSKLCELITSMVSFKNVHGELDYF